MPDHSPEPWKIVLDRDIEDANGETVILGLRDADFMFQSDEPAKEGDLRRIVACVNACRGIKTEELQGHRVVIERGKVTPDMPGTGIG